MYGGCTETLLSFLDFVSDLGPLRPLVSGKQYSMTFLMRFQPGDRFWKMKYRRESAQRCKTTLVQFRSRGPEYPNYFGGELGLG